MGNTQATNSANAIVNSAISVTNNVVQNCLNNTTQKTDISCSSNTAKCPPGTSVCEISHAVINQLNSVDQNCLQNDSSTTTTNNAVAQAVTQTAAAVGAGLGLSPVDASNIVNAAANASTVISQSFNQTLSDGLNQSVGLYGNNCVDRFTYIDINQFKNSSQSAILDTTLVTSATQTLSQTIAQKATAVNLGLVGVLIAIAVLIIAVGFFFKNAAGGAAKLLIPIGILVGAYCGVAYWQKLWPWKKAKIQPSNCCVAGASGAASACPAVNGQPGPACSDTEVCVNSGLDGGNTYCVPTCVSGIACPSGVCSGGECVACTVNFQGGAATSCPQSLSLCVSGTCYQDCSAGQACSGQNVCTKITSGPNSGSSACMPAPNGCNTDLNCAQGQTCQKGQCVTTPGLVSRKTAPSTVRRSPDFMAK